MRAATSVVTGILDVAFEGRGKPAEQRGERRKVGFVPVLHQVVVPLAPGIQDPFDGAPARHGST